MKTIKLHETRGKFEVSLRNCSVKVMSLTFGSSMLLKNKYLSKMPNQGFHFDVCFHCVIALFFLTTQQK